MEIKVPFEVIYVVERQGEKPRIYEKLGPARARITSTLNKTVLTEGKPTFTKDCKIWSVGQNGWEIVFQARQGTSFESINWKNAVEGNTRRAERYENQRRTALDQRDFELYQQLRDRFEN